MGKYEHLTCSQKRYLLAIYQLSQLYGKVKTTQLAVAVGVSKSSSTCMTTKLCERGYLKKMYYGNIELTEIGLKSAELIYSQANTVYCFLTKKLLVDSQKAKLDAVSIVVYSSEQTVSLFVKFIEESDTLVSYNEIFL